MTLNGYDNIRERGVHEWEAVATGGNGTCTYSWRTERPGATDITGYTGPVVGWRFDSRDEEPEGSCVEVTVTSGNETAIAWTALNVETCLRSPCDGRDPPWAHGPVRGTPDGTTKGSPR